MLKHNVIFIYLLLISYSTFSSFSYTTEILAWHRIKLSHPTMYLLLVEALDLTVDEYGPYQINFAKTMNQGRAVVELIKNEKLNIAVFAPNLTRENSLLPIRIPVTKGLLGIRVCLIKKGNADKFKHIYSINDWLKKGLSIGQSSHWPDTKILKVNGFNVVATTLYIPMFDMLAKERFDCFARSVNEVIRELKQYNDKGLELEKNLAFIYRLPTFFFVSKKNPQLAERIEKGLHLAILSGSFDEIFYHGFGDSLDKIKLENRTILHLENPYTTKKTKEVEEDKTLWFELFNQSEY